MSPHTTSASIVNGLLGVGGASVAAWSKYLAIVSAVQEQAAWFGGMIVVILTTINGLMMLRKNWRDRHK